MSNVMKKEGFEIQLTNPLAKCRDCVNKFVRKIQNKKGMSMPEILFWVVLSAIILIIMNNNRKDVMSDQDINNMTQGIDFINMRIKQRYIDGDYSDLTTEKAIDMGIVPRVMTVRGGKVYHPMKGELSISKGGTGDTYIIKVDGLSKATCLALEKYSPESWVSVKASCTAKKNNSVEFEAE